MTEIKTDVLIVGTGPAGSSTAALLSSYGIDNVLINNYSWFQNFSFLDFIRDVGKHLSINYMMAKDDARVVERKKPGQKKARKKFQWVKR